MSSLSRVPERHVPVHGVRVAPTVPLPGEVATTLEVRHYLLHGSFSYPYLTRDVGHEGVGVSGDLEQDPGVVGEERPGITHGRKISRDLTHEKILVLCSEQGGE